MNENKRRAGRMGALLVLGLVGFLGYRAYLIRTNADLHIDEFIVPNEAICWNKPFEVKAKIKNRGRVDCTYTRVSLRVPGIGHDIELFKGRINAGKIKTIKKTLTRQNGGLTGNKVLARLKVSACDGSDDLSEVTNLKFKSCESQ